MIRYISDKILGFFQKRCDHPGQMVAVDILEGCGGIVSVTYCNRCGAVKPEFSNRTTTLWRRPDPDLWRGR